MQKNFIQKKSFPAKSVIFRQGENTKDMYILNEGVLEIIVDGNSVAQIKQRGIFFGEMAFILNEPRAATIRTNTHCECLVIHQKYVVPIINNNPEIGLKLIQILAKRLKQTTIRLSQTKKKNLQLSLQSYSNFPAPVNPYEMMLATKLISAQQLRQAALKFKQFGQLEHKSLLEYIHQTSSVEINDLEIILKLFKKYHQAF